jgi:hypothetical protein
MADYTVKRFEEMEPIFGGVFRRARASLGVSSFGMQLLEMPPNGGDAYPDHDHHHDSQEEVYVILAAQRTSTSRASPCTSSAIPPFVWGRPPSAKSRQARRASRS